MRNYISILMLFLAFYIQAQTPMPSGARFPNATEKSISDVKGVAVFDENNILNGYLNLEAIKPVGNYLNVKDFGAVGDSITDDTESLREALSAVKDGEIKKLFIPKGVYMISGTLYLPDGIELFGDGMNLSVIKLLPEGETGLDLVLPLRYAANPSLVQPRHNYRTMIATESADFDSTVQRVEDINIHDIGIDWGNISSGDNSASPLIMGRSFNSNIYRVRFFDVNARTTTQRSGNSVLFVFSEDNNIYNCVFGFTDYENVSVRNLSDRIHIYRNLFDISKPDIYPDQAHTAQNSESQTVILTNLFGRFQIGSIFYEDNTILMKSGIDHVATSHSAKGFYAKRNYVKYYPTNLAWGIKAFANSQDFDISDNIFDARDANQNQFDVPVTTDPTGVGASFIALNTLPPSTSNLGQTTGRVSGNTILVKNIQPVINTPPDYIAPYIGGLVRESDNLIIDGNVIDIDGYDDTKLPIFGLYGYGNAITLTNNVVRLRNPFTTVTSEGIRFAEVRGGANININNNTVTGTALGSGIYLDPEGTIANMTLNANIFADVVGEKINTSHPNYATAVKNAVYTINGTTANFDGNATVSGGGSGTVTSVGMTTPTGLTVSGSPITTSGTFNIGLQTGYSIPTNSNQLNWSDAFIYSQIGHIPLSQKGANNGVASLDGNGSILGSAVGIMSGGATMMSFYSTTTNTWSQVRLAQDAGNSTIARRNGNGTLTFQDGIANTDGATVGQLNLKANDNAVVKLTGNQNIAGIKTFSSSPIVPDATLPTQAVNKGQLDEVISGNDLQQVLTNGNISDKQIILDTGVDETYISFRSESFSDAQIGALRQHDGNSMALELFDTENTDDYTFLTINGLSIYKNSVLGLTEYEMGGVRHNNNLQTFQDKAGVIALTSDVIDILKALPTYNASTPQVLGHDASGNIQWQAP